MSTRPLEAVSPEEYIEIERASEIKHEYRDGVIVAMTGANMRHNLITANVIRVLGNQLMDGPCRVIPSDMRLKIQKSNRYTYPDAMVICGKAEYEGNRRDTVLNPRIIFEVLSDSTEAYDRGEKFMHYQRIDTLAEYILVSQKEQHVDRFARRDDGQWLYTPLSGENAVLQLTAIDFECPVGRLYQGLDWAE
ncbi:MAG: Uma2 family endonuclease [Acidobacteriota bacterium]|nr:Uma2 family endonuclease [Acidobacteriota bacterium]